MISSGTNVTFAEVKNLIFGAEVARTVTIALFAWMVYEYLITLDDERKHFWKGPFSVSRVLFFFNRYFPPCVIMVDLILYTIKSPSTELCKSSIRSSFFLNWLGISVIQAILITRIWFLCPGEKVVQFMLTFCFLLSLFVSLVFLAISTHDLHVITFSQAAGCHATRPPEFWRIWMPALALHTGLYLMTIRQAITNTQFSKQTNLRSRLLADSGLFYFVVLCSVGLTSVGSLLTNFPQINIPAIYSPIVLATNSVATTRIMFSLRDMFTNEVASMEWITSTPSPLPMSMPKPPPPARSFGVYKNATLRREDSNPNHTRPW